jgi:uncharacterized membrane protein YdjX (TVP38/TMEM64 family)
VVLLAISAAAALAGRAGGQPLVRIVEAIQEAGPAAPILFAAVYVLAVVALIPGSILTLAAGVLFGVGLGVAVVFIAATVGASIAFLIARHLARPSVERRMFRDPSLKAVAEAVEQRGFKIAFLLRLTPLVPFSLLNYALGLSRIRFRDYLLASFGMLPGTLLYVYGGWAAGELTAVAAGQAIPRGPGWYAVLTLGLVATALLVLVLTRLARDTLRQETGIELARSASSQNEQSAEEV